MEIFLERGMPDGVDYDLIESLDHPDYDLLKATGPKLKIEFAIDALTPGYGLRATPATRVGDSEVYEKIALVPKENYAALKKVIFDLFNRSLGRTDN